MQNKKNGHGEQGAGEDSYVILLPKASLSGDASFPARIPSEQTAKDLLRMGPLFLRRVEPFLPF